MDPVYLKDCDCDPLPQRTANSYRDDNAVCAALCPLHVRPKFLPAPAPAHPDSVLRCPFPIYGPFTQAFTGAEC